MTNEEKNNRSSLQESYVSFKTAELLKEKGFDEPLCYVYNEDGKFHRILDKEYSQNTGDYEETIQNSNYNDITKYKYNFLVTAPTQQMAMAWLREVHKTFIQIDYDYYENDGFYYGYSIVKINTLDDNGEVLTEIGGKMFETYEKACEEAIAYCLTNLVQTLHPDMSYDELCEHYEKENEY